jgi:hypothetical protein
MKIMIGTPAYANSVTPAYAISLSQTVLLLAQNGIEVFPLIPPSGSLLVAERNRILEAFWQSDCTHLLCIDSDLGWPAEAVLAMLQQNKDFIAGVYPARKLENKFIFRPVTNKDGSLVNEEHLIKAEYIPAGFMLLSRNCISKMRDKFPELYYSPKDSRAVMEESTYCLFNTEVYEGEFWGEDYVFCRRAREAGNEIWIDPLIQFNHAGQVGMLMDILQRGVDEAEKTMSMAA